MATGNLPLFYVTFYKRSINVLLQRSSFVIKHVFYLEKSDKVVSSQAFAMLIQQCSHFFI